MVGCCDVCALVEGRDDDVIEGGKAVRRGFRSYGFDVQQDYSRDSSTIKKWMI